MQYLNALIAAAACLPVLSFTACADGETPFGGAIHPCVEENDCVLEDGISLCAAGTVWENPSDRDNFNCVAPEPKIGRWALPEGGHADDGLFSVGGGGGPVTSDQWTLLDLDGDGSLDLVLTGRVQPDGNGTAIRGFGLGDSPYWLVHFNSGAGFDSSGVRFSVPDGGHADNGFVTAGGAGGPVTSDQWALTDLDGDLLPDLVLTGRVQPDGNGTAIRGFSIGDSPYWLVHFNNGSGFEATGARWDLPEGGHADEGFAALGGSGGPVTSDQWSMLDVTGDSLPDLVITGRVQPDGNGTTIRSFGLGDGNPFWVVHPNNGTGFAP